MNRRNFLKGLLGAAGVAAAAPSLVEAAEGLLVPERKVWALDRTHLSLPHAGTASEAWKWGEAVDDYGVTFDWFDSAAVPSEKQFVSAEIKVLPCDAGAYEPFTVILTWKVEPEYYEVHNVRGKLLDAYGEHQTKLIDEALNSLFSEVRRS
jgi:hypothetical protein